MTHTEQTETPEEFERKRHYQRLKLECLKLVWTATDNPIKDNAKKMYRSITEGGWGSEPVEETSDG